MSYSLNQNPIKGILIVFMFRMSLQEKLKVGYTKLRVFELLRRDCKSDGG